MPDTDRPLPYHYRISGLSIGSEFELPMRAPLPIEDFKSTDVVFRLGVVPERLPHISHRGPNWAANERSFLLELPKIGRFLCEEGARLTLCPAPGAFLDDIAVFVTGTAMAAILYQRGAMLLHGSAVVHDGRAFLFCGDSGAGKSTLAAALVQAGASFLADDVCSIELSDSAVPRAIADGRFLSLYHDSIGQTGLTDATGSRVRRRIDKYHISVGGGPEASIDSAPVAAIYMLAGSHAAAPPGISQLPNLEAAQALLHNSYRRRVALAYAHRGQIPAQTFRLLSSTHVFLLHRAAKFDALDDTVSMIKAHWAGLR
jgi:hypothetical protein